MTKIIGFAVPLVLALSAGAGCEFGDNLALVDDPIGQVDAAIGEVDAAVGEVDAAAGEVDAPPPQCGDGARQGDEECDDGNQISGDGCSADCRLEEDVPCTLVPQTGCGASEACDLDPSDLANAGTECRPVDAQGGPQDACLADTECAAGHSCAEEPEGAASCLAYCADDLDCVGAGSLCVVPVTYEEGGSTLPVPGVWMCTHSCDPIDAAGCAAGRACRVDRDNLERDYTVCRFHGAGGQGASCTGDADCDSTHWCVSVDGDPQCLRVCEVDSSGACGDEPQTQCHSFVDPVDVEGIEYGACL